MKPQTAELEGPLEICWSNPFIREVNKLTAERGNDLYNGRVFSLSLSSVPISKVNAI